MEWIEKISDKFRIPVRENLLNPLLGGIRKKKLNNSHFTIISNNCWGGHVYRYFRLPYESPTVGLYFYTDDYIRFLSQLRNYVSKEIKFIKPSDSKYYNELLRRGEINKPIGLLGDVEIVFLHYKSEEEAEEKWNRRCKRINWEHLIVKISEQNFCSVEDLEKFDLLPFKQKIAFTTQDYQLLSQVIFGDYINSKEVSNDTLHFRKYVNLVSLINGKRNFKRNQP